MDGRRQILICAFGPFPGVPVNPSARLARHLLQTRRPALADLALTLRILPTRWSSLDLLADLLARQAPDGVLLLGVAPRRRALCVETRAVNSAADRPDSARRHPRGRRIDPCQPAVLRTTARVPPLVAAARAACPATVPSRDAGRYLCNASYFVALARTRAIPVVFVHVPGRPAGGRSVLPAALQALLRAFATEVRAGPPARPTRCLGAESTAKKPEPARA